ncbi:MAG: tetratricopeptide repeat protein [Proteobacteria bacterium]|nr:tetratricopeptide repeat protein [Pseudomonadota bacterium]
MTRLFRVLLLAASVGLAACSSTPHKFGGRSADDVKATAARAEQSYANSEWAAAADAYGVLVEEMPQDTHLWFRYANALARSDQPDKAVTAYREVLVRDAHYSKAWFNMGIVQLRQAANSFSRMGSNISADDPLRAQGEQVYAGITRLLGDDGNVKPAGAMGKAKPGPVAPSSPPASDHDAGGASH